MDSPQVSLFLCGDVMLGRGVDQILPHPGDPALWETYVRDARTYVDLAEKVNGPIPRPVDIRWPWGDALDVLERREPDVRVVNLETSVTRSDDVALGKAVHYRMSPGNLRCLSVARPNVCVLANNHVLDFGRPGLEETLDALARHELATAGAGRDDEQATAPAVVQVDPERRVLVFGLGALSSGVPPSWTAAAGRPGVATVPDLRTETAAAVVGRIQRFKRPGDLVVVSIHWGSNWGYDVPREQVRFAHALVDGGVDVVHGHSSHHPRPIEVYRGRLILYGCGDFIDDYEGITGYEEFRDDLRLLYFASLGSDTGELTDLVMVPMQAQQMRLRHASPQDAEWVGQQLGRISDRGTGVRIRADHDEQGILRLSW